MRCNNFFDNIISSFGSGRHLGTGRVLQMAQAPPPTLLLSLTFNRTVLMKGNRYYLHGICVSQLKSGILKQETQTLSKREPTPCSWHKLSWFKLANVSIHLEVCAVSTNSSNKLGPRKGVNFLSKNGQVTQPTVYKKKIRLASWRLKG